MAHRPPMNDVERLENVIEGLWAALEDEGPSVDEIRAEAEAAGIDLAAWGAEIRAKARARVQAERRAKGRRAQSVNDTK